MPEAEIRYKILVSSSLIFSKLKKSFLICISLFIKKNLTFSPKWNKNNNNSGINKRNILEKNIILVLGN
jgi:hypothetical protein